MSVFKKLFKRKKNEIHLSAEEAFAKEPTPAPSAPQPDAPQVPDEIPPCSNAEDQTTALSAEEQSKFRKVFYLGFDKIEDAPTSLRSALRSCVRAVSESGDRFEVTLSDQSLITLTRQPFSARSKFPEALLTELDAAPADVSQRVLGLNQALDITPLRKGESFSDSYGAFLEAMMQQLVCCELTDDMRLVRSDGTLLWDAEGKTELGEAEKQNEPEAKTERDAPSSKEAPADGAASESSKPKSRAERSLELIASHGIQPDVTYSVEIDENRVFPRSIKETAERISALTVTALVAQAYTAKNSASPASWSAALVNRYETLYSVKRSFTLKESAYLRDPGANRHSLFVLKAEAAAILMWALGYMDIGWPDKQADLGEISGILKINDINLLCTKAKARDKEELLDMYDLTVRLHALCVRTGFKELKQTGLDPDIIYERHYALNWLLGIGGFTAWDNIIPST